MYLESIYSVTFGLGLVCQGRAMPACCEVMCRGESEGGVSCDSGALDR